MGLFVHYGPVEEDEVYHLPGISNVYTQTPVTYLLYSHVCQTLFPIAI